MTLNKNLLAVLITVGISYLITLILLTIIKEGQKHYIDNPYARDPEAVDKFFEDINHTLRCYDKLLNDKIKENEKLKKQHNIYYIATFLIGLLVGYFLTQLYNFL